jgi:hypothetical protein
MCTTFEVVKPGDKVWVVVVGEAKPFILWYDFIGLYKYIGPMAFYLRPVVNLLIAIFIMVLFTIFFDRLVSKLCRSQGSKGKEGRKQQYCYMLCL